ncbi:MAG: hypothetical protein EZS28_041804, partial [Streblomastix strix]
IMSYSKYAQIQVAKGNHPDHWRGTPSGSQNEDPNVCWCCRFGCFALMVLKVRGLNPTQANICPLLDEKADLDPKRARLTEKSSPEENYIGKIKYKGHFHYVHILSKRGDGSFDCYNSDGDKIQPIKASEFLCCYKVN